MQVPEEKDLFDFVPGNGEVDEEVERPEPDGGDAALQEKVIEALRRCAIPKFR